ncbi:MAG: hypothetical protein ACRDYA_19705 [Egibacteraceae bacterium]
MNTLDDVLGLDEFFVQQRFALLVNLYRISTVGPDGRSEGAPLAYVRQKRMKIREEIEFFADEGQTVPLMRLEARKVFEFRGRTEVQLPDGVVIGQLQKVFGASLLRSAWQVLDAEGKVVATARESSMVIAVLRRVWDLVPFVEYIPVRPPFHFDLFVGDRKVGRYTRLLAFRDRYVMDLSDDPERIVDRRVAMAFCIALDALQDR